MHYYKRNIGDYHKKAGRLTMLQHGAFTLLMDSCYDRERFPTLEDAVEWVWASSKEEIEAVEFVLKRFFTDENGCFVQQRIADELAKYHQNAETNKRIANERETKRRENSTNRARTVNEPNTLEHEAPPNHKPLTTNQEPIKTLVKPSAKVDVIPYQKIVDSYNANLPMLRRCVKVTDKIKNTIRKSWNADERHQNFEFWDRYFSATKMLKQRIDFWSGVDGGAKHGLDLIARRDIFERTIEELIDMKARR